MRIILDQIALHLVQLPLFIVSRVILEQMDLQVKWAHRYVYFVFDSLMVY